MSVVAWALLAAAVAGFSRLERGLWGSARTPFAFVAVPLLGTSAFALLVGPPMGFIALRPATIGVVALCLACFALVSAAMATVARPGLRGPSPLEGHGAALAAGAPERGVSTLEYLAVGLVLLVAFRADLLGGAGALLEKGELGVGSLKSHLLPIGMAWMLMALAQRRGAGAVRAGLIVLVLWLLAINQVKYLIFLPLAGGLLYRWMSGQIGTARLAAIAAVVPLSIVVLVYAFFGIAAAQGGVPITAEVVLELGAHMVSYLVSGLVGLDQLLAEGRTAWFGAEGLHYAFAPFENLARFAAGAGNYFNVVNPLYLPITRSGSLDSNVFTMFGSLLLRGGWVGAVGVVMVYAAVTYGVWARWRQRTGPVACAAGAWWMAPLLFAWHDPFFIHLTLIEVMVLLWLRARVR